MFAALRWQRHSCLCSYERTHRMESSPRRIDQRRQDANPFFLSSHLPTFRPSNLPTPNRPNLLTSLESALPQNPPATPVESAHANLKDLNSFRIRTYKKTWGVGVLWLTNPLLLCAVLVLFLSLLPSSAQGQTSVNAEALRQPEPLLAQATSLADNGSPSQAEPLARQYLEAHPDSA